MLLLLLLLPPLPIASRSRKRTGSRSKLWDANDTCMQVWNQTEEWDLAETNYLFTYERHRPIILTLRANPVPAKSQKPALHMYTCTLSYKGIPKHTHVHVHRTTCLHKTIKEGGWDRVIDGLNKCLDWINWHLTPHWATYIHAYSLHKPSACKLINTIIYCLCPANPEQKFDF